MPDLARSHALQALAKVEAGEDPMDEKLAKRSAITVKDLADKLRTSTSI